MRIQLLHLYPDLMNLYGEYANVAALRRSLERQGAEVVVRTGTLYEDIDFSDADFVYMGAGTRGLSPRGRHSARPARSPPGLTHFSVNHSLHRASPYGETHRIGPESVPAVSRDSPDPPPKS